MPNLSQHACFNCRKVFKKPHEYRIPDKQGVRLTRTVCKCPQCGGEMIYMGYKFRAPAMNDTDEWHRIEQALKDGRDYAFQTVRKPKPKSEIEPALRIALGIYGKRRPKTA